MHEVDLVATEAGDPELSGAPEPARLAGLVVRDQAKALYDYAAGGLAMSAVASLFLAIMIETSRNLDRVLGWLCAMAVVLGVRTLDLLLWYPRRSSGSAGAAAEIRRYATGVAAAALVWIAFPPLFFHSMTETSRAGAAVVLAAMAGGSPIMLGAVSSVSIGYCLSLILPFSWMFLLQPGRVNLSLGTLGLFDAVVMTGTCIVLHHRVIDFIRLARRHQLMMADAILQQDRTAAANASLEAAQAALHEANQLLESRIEARTADLQHEITERKSYARALARLASTDSLTGLLNRATLSERLAELLKDAARAEAGLAVLFLDLDGFKQINDLQGHDVGDHVLRVVAGRLMECCLGADVARWGGDEFVIVTTRCAGEASVLPLAERIRRALTAPIETDPPQGGRRTVRIGVTIGVSLCPRHGASQDELISAADVAMYSGKKEGGGRLTVFNTELARLISERRLIEQSLRKAPGDGALALHYQPIVNAASGRCDVMEALLRWTHPELGRISPEIFIPIAEQSEQIVAIGRFVLFEACGAAMAWPGPDPPAVAVNISIAQILSGHLLEDVQAALDASGLPVHRLHLEITESMFVADPFRIMPPLEALHARGVCLALDDFGTGFSSLARLKTLPIDTIKIDRAFVQEESEEGFAIIRAMLLIARAMQLDVTAEGVETESQRSMLADLGATRLQGYLLSRPMPAAMVSAWLSSTQLRLQPAHPREDGGGEPPAALLSRRGAG